MICKRIFQAIMSVIPLAKAVENKWDGSLK